MKKNKKLKTLLTTGALAIGLCTGCGNNEKITALQEKYNNSQQIIEQYKKDNEKLTKENEELKADKKELEKEKRNLEQDKRIAELDEEEKNENAWYTCEKCGITNGDVKIHNGFYMCPNCIEKSNNSTSTNKNTTTNTSKSNSSFNISSGDNTTYQPTSSYVYWTPNGKSYHSRKNCPTLKRSKTIREGYNCPKTDPCNICVKNKSNNYSNYNYDDNQDYYIEDDSITIPKTPEENEICE